MADNKKEIQGQQKLNALKKEMLKLEADQLGLSSSLVDSIREAQGLSTKRSQFDKETLKINTQIAREISNQASEYNNIADIQKQQAKNAKLIEQGLKTENALTSNLSKAEQKKVQQAKKQIGIISSMNKYQKDALANAAKTGQINQHRVDIAEDLKNKAFDILSAETSGLSVAAKQAIFTSQQTESLKEKQKELEKNLEQEKELQKRMGATGAALKGMEGLLKKIGLGDLSNAMGFDKINADLREFAKTGASSQEIFQKGIELSGEAIKTALKDPLVQVAIAAKAFATGFNMSIGALIKGIKALEEDTGKLAKNLNVGAQQARQMSEDFAAASIGSDRLFVSSKGLAQSTVDINDALGTSVLFTAEQLATFTALRETAGLTSEEMMGIMNLSQATGGNFDDILDSTLNQVDAVAKQTGISLNNKKIMTEIANVSEATQLSLGKSGPAIGAAVATAKALGMELGKVEDIAGSLLNFESSIKDELAAELLIGKNINLEKARQAALNNDLETVATEIAKQAGSAAEFGEMNRIQQDALAKAVGMSRDELGKTLFVQEQLAGVSGIDRENRAKMLESLTDQYGLEKAQAMLADKGLSNLMNQASETEKIQKSFEKIGEFVKKIGAAFAPVVEMMGSVAAYLSQSEIIMSALVGILGAVGVALTVVAGKALITFGISVGKMFADVVSGMSKLGPPGVIAGLALGGVAVAGAIGAYQSLKADDMAMAPSSPGYGDRILSTPKGSISLNNEDTIVAGTSLGQNKGSTDMSRTNKLLSAMVRQQKKLKPIGLYNVSKS